MANSKAETQSLTPDPENTRGFRDALGRFATGVTVVTANSEIGPLGITANSFASVSLDPPLILWSPAKSSRRFKTFAEATHFAVHVIGQDQMDICQQFSKDGADFTGLDWGLSEQKVPLLEGCLARFACETVTTHDGGDHQIVVARVTQATWRKGEPLLFSQGSFGQFKDLP